MKKLLCLLLCLATLLSAAMLGGCAKEESVDVDSNVDTSRTAVTLSMWIISENKVSKETEKEVEDAINEFTKSKFTTKIDLVFCTEEEYKEKVDKRFDKIVNRPAGTPIKPVTKGEMYELDDEGFKVLAYPEVGAYQMDIVLINSEDMLREYVNDGHLMSLNEALGDDYKIISTYIYNDILDNAKIDGEWFAVPNNQLIGEFTYMMVNKKLADDYYYTDYFDGSQSAAFGIDQPVAELIELIAKNEDTSKIAPVYGMADFPLVKYWNTTGGLKSVLATVYPGASVQCGAFSPKAETLFADGGYQSFMKLMFHCKENGYFMTTQETFGVGVLTGDYTLYDQYKDDYYIIPLAYPRLEQADVFSSMFAVTKYTANEQRALEIIEELTCRSELRNMLQYGVEGKHYTLDEDGAVKRIRNEDGTCDYLMNLAYTGNAMMAYPEEGMPLDIWKAAVQQNLQSLLSGVFGSDDHLKSVNAEAWKQMSEISDSYFQRLYVCETISEFETYMAVASKEISATDYYTKLTTLFLPNNEVDTSSLSGALTQWWTETFGGQ